MNVRFYASVALVTLGLVLAAVPASAQDRTSRSRQALRAEVVDQESRVLRLGADGTLTLTNLMGDIRVRTDSGNDVRVEIRRIARGRTEADARRGLASVTVNVGERANRGSVETIRPAERNAPYAVTIGYDVTAPAGTSITARSLTGNIDVAGITGELTAESTTGNIEIRDAPQLARARTATGRIHLANVGNDGTLEAGTIAGAVLVEALRARRLLVGTLTGAVTARDATADRAELTSTAGTIEYSGPVAPNGRYELRSHAGLVRFVVADGSGFELRASSFTGVIAPGESLGLSVVRRHLHELVGTVGDGRASVTLATFSGEIVIVRR